MARGRPPKPNTVKIAEGNPGHRPLNPEPALSDKKPRCPDYLSDEAKREWHRVVDDLHSAGLLRKVDTTILALYCQARADYIEAREEIKIHGSIVMTPNGYPQKSAWVTIRDKAFDQIMKCLQELGMTPVARARVAASETPKIDPFDEWFGKNSEAPQKPTKDIQEENADVLAYLDALEEENQEAA